MDIDLDEIESTIRETEKKLSMTRQALKKASTPMRGTKEKPKIDYMKQGLPQDVDDFLASLEDGESDDVELPEMSDAAAEGSSSSVVPTPEPSGVTMTSSVKPSARPPSTLAQPARQPAAPYQIGARTRPPARAEPTGTTNDQIADFIAEIEEDVKTIGESMDKAKKKSEAPKDATMGKPRGRALGKAKAKPLPQPEEPKVHHETRCFPVCVGGTDFPLAHDNGLNSCCDNLFCISCAFTVVTFENVAWHEDCDSLFFRNMVPNRLKLEQKLDRAADYRAYCCQCSWLALSSKKELSGLRGYRWVCHSHRGPD